MWGGAILKVTSFHCGQNHVCVWGGGTEITTARMTAEKNKKEKWWFFAGFRSGLWLVHPNRICFYLNHPIISLAGCSGWFSCRRWSRSPVSGLLQPLCIQHLAPSFHLPISPNHILCLRQNNFWRSSALKLCRSSRVWFWFYCCTVCLMGTVRTSGCELFCSYIISYFGGFPYKCFYASASFWS